MVGTIQENGYILGENKKLYAPDIIFNSGGRLSILLAASSWARFHIDDVVGKQVEFNVNKNKGYYFKLIN